jgi:hypothetical protein
MGIDPGTLPATVHCARERLFSDGFYFVPVRHHSPACAYALKQLIREVGPAAVLIEGPETFNDLIPLLLESRTSPPIAVLVQAAGTAPSDVIEGPSAGNDAPVPETASRSAFFPFCDYSPEWVALREGSAGGSQTAFIDLAWSEQARSCERKPDEHAVSLMAERYLAHSRYIGSLAARAGCRDQDELWDHLFELRSRDALRDWRAFFPDVFAYCAMARLDYEPEVLEAEGSLPRERHMETRIREWRSRVTGPIVIVTGGFHTMELVARLHRKGDPAETGGKGRTGAVNNATNADQWLIRYSFDRLDALNGYASGMPSPAYHQRVWNGLLDGSADHLTGTAAGFLTEMARATRSLQLSDFISTAHVQSALVQSVRLAALRGHSGPGRQDLLDAVFSCFVKGAIDEGVRGLTRDVRKLLGGSRMGDIPPSAGSPPLLEDARRMARRCGLALNDSTPRQSRLDLYRKPAHRERSRFLHLMNYIGAGLAEWRSGPDFLGNSRLDLLFEEWRYAWTPLVEANLIDLADRGATLSEVALSTLRAEEASLAEGGRSRSAAGASALLVRACVIGLQERLAALFPLLEEHLNQDSSFASVVECGHRLATLWRAREPLGVQGDSRLEALLDRIWPAALFLLSDLELADESTEPDMVRCLISLRELGRILGTSCGERTGPDMGLMHERLSRFTARPDVAPGICGAAAAILFIDGCWGEERLVNLLSARFGIGTEPGVSVRCLTGLMSAAPELLLRIPRLLSALDAIIAGWDEATFVSHLPDLRLAFTHLKPRETGLLADRVARLTGLKTDDLVQPNYEATEQDLFRGTRLQVELVESLKRDGLPEWADGTEMV